MRAHTTVVMVGALRAFLLGIMGFRARKIIAGMTTLVTLGFACAGLISTRCQSTHTHADENAEHQEP